MLPSPTTFTNCSNSNKEWEELGIHSLQPKFNMEFIELPHNFCFSKAEQTIYVINNIIEFSICSSDIILKL